MGNIKVIVEPHGSKPLIRVFPYSESNKVVESIIERMVKDSYEGKDIVACEAVRAEMNSSGGYGIAKRTGGEDKPVVYEPIELGTPLKNYETEGDNMPVVRIAVNGFQRVGTNYK